MDTGKDFTIRYVSRYMGHETMLYITNMYIFHIDFFSTALIMHTHTHTNNSKSLNLKITHLNYTAGPVVTIVVTL